MTRDLFGYEEDIRRGDPPVSRREPWFAGRRLCTCKPPIVTKHAVWIGDALIGFRITLDVGLMESPHATDCDKLR